VPNATNGPGPNGHAYSIPAKVCYNNSPKDANGTLIFNKEKRRILSCRAGIEFFYLAPEGVVYPCLTIPSPMGDLRGRSFEDVWESSEADAVRHQIDGCEQCWMICTARSSLKKNLPRALGWIAREKLRAHAQ
jgi:MoaA/NifB/PqqE/SkfB family radical SAM enzyme